MLTALLVVLLLGGCANAEPKGHSHTWENRKCTVCGAEKEIFQLGNWEYVLWEETGTMEIVSFLDGVEPIPFQDLPANTSNVLVAEGITAIPDSAFLGCRSLKGITLPQSLVSIGKDAFSCCGSLVCVDIPKGVTSIGARAFAQCGSLAEIVIPEGVTAIGDCAFLMCGSLKRVTIPDSVTSMEGNPFWNTPAEIQVSSRNPAFRVIDGVLFDKAGTRLIACPCNKTGAYEIPQGVLEIGRYAFDNCDDLTCVTIPASVVSIEGNPFGYADLLELKLTSENPSFALVDGVLFDKTRTRLLAYPQGRPGDAYEIPAGTVEIGDYAFAGCEQLQSITIPESVTSIAASAFWNCDKPCFYAAADSHAEQYCIEYNKKIIYQ